jgi:hypothetical protein
MKPRCMLVFILLVLLESGGVHNIAAQQSVADKEPFRFAYISRNVDCYVPGQPSRQKYVSQVFGYCYGEVSQKQILEDSKIDFRRAVLNDCGDRYNVSYEYVNGPNDTADQAEQQRQRELQESGYGKHISWHAALDYESSRCE